MAAVVPSSDQAADLLKNLSIDSQAKTLEVPEPTKKTTVNNVNGQVQSGNKTGAPLVSDYVDPTLAYYQSGYPYYYGYDGSTTDWEEYNRYMSSDDLAHGVYGYGYAPYAPYSPAGSPVPTVGQDGQYYGGQQYQYPSPFFQPLTPTGTGYQAPAPTKGDTTAPAAADKPSLAVDTTKGNTNGAKGNTVPLKPTTYQYNANGTYGSGGLSSYQDPRFGYGGVTSPISWMDSSMYTNPLSRNNTNTPASYGKGVASKTPTNLMNQRPLSGVNTTTGYMNRLYPNNLYGQYGSTYRSGYGYGSSAYDLQNNGRGWMTVDNKYKPRGRGNGFFGYNNENSDGLNELNRGPRSRITKSPKVFTPIAIAVKGQEITLAPTESIEKDVKEVAVKDVKDVSVTSDREQYNKADFPETYADAKFFIIKSYSEDDVHKSIKYNVWASTQNGNKKLDAAYQEAQQKPEGCPIFLFFSVNTSGQFVGVAEMVGPVDFNKSLEYWQQDKWIGCFPVKWHIVKDLPNSLLKHIILENNENKPVTNSRDTQEVKLDQGLQVIKIFKEHSSKQCILDDFEFYEDRQKKIQEKKAKQQQFQKQAWEGKPAIDDKTKESVKEDATKSVDAVTTLVSDVKLVNNGVEDVAKPLEEKVVANGIANGC